MLKTHPFNEMAMDLFHDQAQNVPVYASYLSHLGVDHRTIDRIEDIPFLPIKFFKSHKVLRSGESDSFYFSSSSTTGMGQSRHFVADTDTYKRSSIALFEEQYGSLEEFEIFALLPNYLERQGSSLIFMVDQFIKESEYGGDFYLYDHKRLLKDIRKSNAPKKLLIGVSFALLDLAESLDASEAPMGNNVIVMETGGMKGRRKEMTRQELHEHLKAGFEVPSIHSEYGMTELLSQAYSTGEGVFRENPRLKVLIRAVDDPFSLAREGKAGGINVIDLNNRNSCGFIATDDLGRKVKNDSFEVMGRFDHSDARGCNLLVAQ